MIIGIDVGASGGLAALNGEGELRQYMRMPTLKQRGKTIVDGRAVHKFLNEADDGGPMVIVIEAVHAMPAQGVTSSFQFGRAAGAVEAVSLIRGCPVHWVTPSVWKKHYGLSKNKRESMDAARLRFGADKIWDVLANDGIAEAALIALYWLNCN